MPSALVIAMAVLFSTQPVDSNESLLHFQTWEYVLIGVLYSVLVFFARFLDRFVGFDQNPIGFVNWSGYSSIPRFRTHRSLSKIFAIHCLYLLILLCCIRTAALSFALFPNWSTTTVDVGKGDQASIVDIGLVLFGTILAFVERRHLCSGTNDAQIDDDLKDEKD